MTWVRLEDDAALHPKLLKLSDGAFRLWIHGISLANRATTDGKIDKVLIASLNHHGRWSKRQMDGFIAELVGPLWVDMGDHYFINDYEHHQAEAMKDRVERKRELDRQRQRNKRERDIDEQRESLGMSRRDTDRESRSETSVPSRKDKIREEKKEEISPTPLIAPLRTRPDAEDLCTWFEQLWSHVTGRQLAIDRQRRTYDLAEDAKRVRSWFQAYCERNSVDVEETIRANMYGYAVQEIRKKTRFPHPFSAWARSQDFEANFVTNEEIQ